MRQETTAVLKGYFNSESKHHLSGRETVSNIRRIMAVSESEELARVLEEVSDHEEVAKLSEVTAKVLLERAEGARDRLDVEEGLAERLAQESSIEKEQRTLSGEDPFELLEGGPKSMESAALLSVLLARGISTRIDAKKDDKAKRAVIVGLLERLDWIEATTALSPYEALTAVLESPMREVLWTTAAQDLVEVTRAKPVKSPNAWSRHHMGLLVRANALSHAPKKLRATLATNVLVDLEGSALKRVALAALAGVDDAASTSNHVEVKSRDSIGALAASAARIPKLSGELDSPPWGGVVRLLAAVTGVLLVRWLYRLVARYVMGWRRTATVAVSANTVTVDEKAHLLGRVIREGKATHSLRSLRKGAVEQRFRYLHLLAGALGLVLLVTLGVNFLVEGACSGYSPLALFGLAVIGGGILLDVLLEVLVPGKKGLGTVTLDFGRRKLVRLRGVGKEQAHLFIKELDLLIPPPKNK